MGENPIQAALNGRSEIGMAAIAVTLTDVVVYVPISFMSGNLGKLFREFGLTIACATLLSLMVSFTLVPVLASRWLKAHDEEGHEHGFAGAWERGFDRLAHTYRRLLGWALAAPARSSWPRRSACFVLSILPLPLNLIGQEYAPNEDDGQFTINTLDAARHVAGGEQRGDGAHRAGAARDPGGRLLHHHRRRGRLARRAAPTATAQIAVQLSREDAAQRAPCSTSFKTCAGCSATSRASRSGPSVERRR